MSTTATLKAQAANLLATIPSTQLVEIYLQAFDNVAKNDSKGWMAAADVRGWAQETLDAHGHGKLLTDALGVCATCWADLTDGVCQECAR